MSKEIEKRVIHLVSEETGANINKISPETALLHDLGVDGDDADEFIIRFADEFDVDISEFQFEEYFGSEGGFCPFFIFSPSWWKGDHKLKRLTIMDLINAAKVKKL